MTGSISELAKIFELPLPFIPASIGGFGILVVADG
jgi:hypothetical protein